MKPNRKSEVIRGAQAEPPEPVAEWGVPTFTLAQGEPAEPGRTAIEPVAVAQAEPAEPVAMGLRIPSPRLPKILGFPPGPEREAKERLKILEGFHDQILLLLDFYHRQVMAMWELYEERDREQGSRQQINRDAARLRAAPKWPSDA